MGRLDFGGVLREACLAYVPEAKSGDYAIVHVGFALNLLSEAEAQATLETLRQIVDFGAGDPPDAEDRRVKYVDEYRDAHLVRGVLDEIRRRVTRPWVIMEICGGQTHAIVRHGLDQLLPRTIELVHGPGCPVCVTSLELIDKALAIASRPEVIFTSYGDMLRVPGLGPRSVRRAGRRRRRARRLLAARRRQAGAGRTRTSRWSSSPSVSRRPRRRM